MADGKDKLIVRVDPGVRELIPDYLARREADVERLRVALESGDFAVIRVIGHNLHGSGGAYGFDRVSSIGAGLEQAAAARDTAAVALRLAELSEFLVRVEIR